MAPRQRDSKLTVFGAALVGALIPRLVELVSSDKTIKLPGQTWQQATGWAVMAVTICLLAGYIAVYVWKENDGRRGFALGLGFLYAVTGGSTDLGKSFRILPAEAQPVGSVATTVSRVGAVDVRIMMPTDSKSDDVAFKATVYTMTDSAAGSRAYFSGTRPISSAWSFAAEPGTYTIKVQVAGYRDSYRSFEIIADRRTALEIQVSRPSIWRQFGEGLGLGLTREAQKANRE